MNSILVTKRGDDVHVCLKGEAGVWASGKTADEAIGSLIRSYPERFDIEIAWKDGDTATRNYLTKLATG